MKKYVISIIFFLISCHSGADVISGFSIEKNRDKAMSNKSSKVNVTYYKTLAYDKKKNYQLKGENYQSNNSEAGIGNTNVVAGDGSTVVVITEIEGENIAIGK